MDRFDNEGHAPFHECTGDQMKLITDMIKGDNSRLQQYWIKADKWEEVDPELDCWDIIYRVLPEKYTFEDAINDTVAMSKRIASGDGHYYSTPTDSVLEFINKLKESYDA